MVEQAKETIAGLGLTSALERRYAIIGDVTINNVLFADRRARKAIAGTCSTRSPGAWPTARRRSSTRSRKCPSSASSPRCCRAPSPSRCMLENRHGGNLVSLVAPSDPERGPALQVGQQVLAGPTRARLADSIKERVKKAGGNVTGDLCCRLAWNNKDDLDLHMHEPKAVAHLLRHASRSLSPNGGMLDVDANGMDGLRETPPRTSSTRPSRRCARARTGLSVHQYNNRDAANSGFEVEIDWLGTVHKYASERSPKQGETIEIAEMTYSQEGRHHVRQAAGVEGRLAPGVGPGDRVLPPRVGRDAVAELLGRRPVGNKHYFFMLDGCANDGTARGFFNEFLMPAFDKHRKVFEMVGSKMKVAPASEQLSGLGFSSTQRNTLTAGSRAASPGSSRSFSRRPRHGPFRASRTPAIPLRHPQGPTHRRGPVRPPAHVSAPASPTWTTSPRA
jgi:hypothetical protein